MKIRCILLTLVLTLTLSACSATRSAGEGDWPDDTSFHLSCTAFSPGQWRKIEKAFPLDGGWSLRDGGTSFSAAWCGEGPTAFAVDPFDSTAEAVELAVHCLDSVDVLPDNYYPLATSNGLNPNTYVKVFVFPTFRGVPVLVAEPTYVIVHPDKGDVDLIDAHNPPHITAVPQQVGPFLTGEEAVATAANATGQWDTASLQKVYLYESRPRAAFAFCPAGQAPPLPADWLYIDAITGKLLSFP